MAKSRKEAMRAEWAANLADLRRRWLIFTGKRVNTDNYQELLRQHVVPWGCRTYHDGLFFRFSTGLHRKNHPVADGGILVSGGLALYIFAGLQPTQIANRCICRQKSRLRLTQTYCPMSVHCRRIWPASSGIHLQNLPLIPQLPLSRG